MSVNNTATITIVDETKCVVTGLTDPHHQHFATSYAILTENYYFNPKYKLGSWDGKIRYFHADGVTFVHLLPEIIPTLVQFGYEIDVKDLRVSQAFSPKLITNDIFQEYKTEEGNPIILYDHQLRVANDLIREGSGTAVAATGAGKTYICAALSKQYNDVGARVIIIVPSQDLVLQTRLDIQSVGIDCGEYSGDIKEFSNPTVVSTWQALKNNKTIINNFDVVIVDECHGLKGNVLQDILINSGGDLPHRFGVTGTLPKGKTDAMAVKIAVGPVLTTVTAKELQDAGILSRLHISVCQLEEDFKEKYEEYKNNPHLKTKPVTYTKFKDSYFPDYTSEKSYTQRNETRLKHLAGEIEALGKEGNTFVLIDGINFGKKLASMIPNAVFLHGTDKKKARKEIYDKFKDNDNMIVIANVQIASTGLNIKRIYNLVLVDIGKSFTRVIQSIGRGLRTAPDKDFVDVYDFCSDLKYGKRHLAERVKFYKEAEYPHSKKVIDYQVPFEL